MNNQCNCPKRRKRLYINGLAPFWFIALLTFTFSKDWALTSQLLYLTIGFGWTLFVHLLAQNLYPNHNTKK